MNEKMTVLFVKETRHVLALLTRAADPEAAAAATELAGESLLVRYVGDTTRTFTPDANFNVPADELDAQTVDFDPDVFAQPRNFSLEEDKNVKPHDLVTTAPAAALPASSDSQIEVTAGAAVADDTPVWLNITDGSTSKTRTDKIAASQTKVTVNVGQMSPGTY